MVLSMRSVPMPLAELASVVPNSLAVTDWSGVPLAYLAAAVVLALLPTACGAMARPGTNAAAFRAFTAPGIGRVAGVGASGVVPSAYNPFQCASYRGFGAIHRAGVQRVLRFLDVNDTLL